VDHGSKLKCCNIEKYIIYLCKAYICKIVEAEMGIEDKPKHIRGRVTLPAEIYDVLNDKMLVGRIIDISAGGVALVTRKELPVNTPLSLNFKFENVKYRRVAADVVREIKERKRKLYWYCFQSGYERSGAN